MHTLATGTKNVKKELKIQ